MNPLHWNSFTLTRLGRIVLRKVMKNLRSVDGATLQFGEMGQGIALFGSTLPGVHMCGIATESLGIVIF
ncbi:hypothetical protein [Pseudomonas baltica]|uniref:hypothetical protein n=1 Tax=Pseudomonas baltica TaxID=2762576 RepID=UPI0028991D9B|nr:hypothetical protein [Pseudomonas baltica]